ncbi:hypothetical protein [Caldivirga sp. UBA161]|uniref:hypothetical protein n=1 Tax=Caldivirga sp. UBA161 TaxID=1915569 RepID=UPI0025C123C5|nr:hypothetical protein [Caldivirga sp. UBA161]
MLKQALIIQLTLTGIITAFLQYLNVESLGVYLSIYAIIYLTSMLLAEPMPRRVRRIHFIMSALLVAAFTYFAVIKVMQILG